MQLASHIHTPLEAQTSKCPEDHPPPIQEESWWTNTLFLCVLEFLVLRHICRGSYKGPGGMGVRCLPQWPVPEHTLLWPFPPMLFSSFRPLSSALSARINHLHTTVSASDSVSRGTQESPVPRRINLRKIPGPSKMHLEGPEHMDSWEQKERSQRPSRRTRWPSCLSTEWPEGSATWASRVCLTQIFFSTRNPADRIPTVNLVQRALLPVHRGPGAWAG